MSVRPSVCFYFGYKFWPRPHSAPDSAQLPDSFRRKNGKTSVSRAAKKIELRKWLDFFRDQINDSSKMKWWILMKSDRVVKEIKTQFSPFYFFLLFLRHFLFLFLSLTFFIILIIFLILILSSLKINVPCLKALKEFVIAECSKFYLVYL